MNFRRNYIPLGCDQQGRLAPTRQLQHEDATGLCDTCTGELDTPESVYQRDAGPEPWPWPATWILLAMLFGAPLAAWIAVKFGAAP